MLLTLKRVRPKDEKCSVFHSVWLDFEGLKISDARKHDSKVKPHPQIVGLKQGIA